MNLKELKEEDRKIMDPGAEKVVFNALNLEEKEMGEKVVMEKLKIKDKRVLRFLFEITQRNLSNSNYGILGYSISLLFCIFVLIITAQNMLYIEKNLLLGFLWFLIPILTSIYLVFRMISLSLKIRSYKQDSRIFFEEISQEKEFFDISKILRIYLDSVAKIARLRWFLLTFSTTFSIWILLITLDNKVGFISGIHKLFPLRFWDRGVDIKTFSLLLISTLVTLIIILILRLLFTRLKTLEIEHYIQDKKLRSLTKKGRSKIFKNGLLFYTIFLATTIILMLLLLNGIIRT